MSDTRPSWTALVVDDDAGVRQSLRLCLEAAGARVRGVATGAAALEAIDRSRFDVVFLDLWLGPERGMEILPTLLTHQPGIGVIVVTAFATFESAVEAIKRGAADYIPKPFTPDQVRLAARRVLESQRLRRRLLELEQQLDESEERLHFQSQSAAFHRLLGIAGRAAASDSVVLLRGESGTGKKALAHWIRANSSRVEGPFVSVNCSGFTGELIARIREADGGTLFLNEVGELPMEAQAQLLQFLDGRAHVDVRVLAATRHRIEDYVKSGRFREDLFDRLSVITLDLKPLRERPEDIVPLARHYLDVLSRKQQRSGLSFSAAAEHALQRHQWPGNLRELRNAVERAVIVASDQRLEPGDLGLEDESNPSEAHWIRVNTIGEMVSLAAIEREHVARVIARSPSLEAAARTLGIDATTLQRKRKRFGLA